MPTPEEIKADAIRGIVNRSGPGPLPLPPFQFEPLPVEIVKAFPAMTVWLRTQNTRLIEHNRKQNVVLTV